jgi:GT2 family glycosyltransferase
MNDGNDFCCGASRLWSSLNWWKHVTDAQSTTSIARTLRDISLLPKGINRINGFRDLNEFTFIGSFGCLKSDTFAAVGGFDEGFPGWGYEDTDLMMKLCLRDFKYALLAESGISVVHLTHPVNMVGDFKRNFQRFHDLEQTRGFLFHVNHFFGVYEGDGYSVLTKL